MISLQRIANFAKELNLRRDSMNFTKSSLEKALAMSLLLLMITSATLITVNNPVEAQSTPAQPVSGSLPSGANPAISVDTTAYLSIRPTVVGLGQTFIVNLFPIPAPKCKP